MKHIDDLKDKLCEEVDIIAKKGDISMSDLERVHKLTDTIKNIEKIKMYSEYSEEDEEYSQRRGRSRNAHRDSMGRYSRDGGGSYRGGSSYDDGSYDDGGSSYRRGGYSRAEGKEHMMQKLETMMDNAENVREREALQKCLRELKNVQ
jgi:hypothetical protein